MDDSLNQCMICLHDWSPEGPHRVVSLECGHLFGRECIFKWLSKTMDDASCPICKRPSKREDIRMIYLENQSSDKVIKNVKSFAKSRIQQIQRQLGEEKKKRVEIEMRMNTMRKTILDYLGDKRNKDDLQRMLDENFHRFVFHSSIKIEMRYFDFGYDVNDIIYGKSRFISIESINSSGQVILDIKTVKRKEGYELILFCEDSTYISIMENSIIVNLKIKANCHYQFNSKHFFGTETGNLYIYDEKWSLLDNIQYKNPIFGIVADSKFILTVHGKHGVFKRVNGEISIQWAENCKSICYDLYSMQCVVSIEETTSMKHYVFSDLNQVETRYVLKPSGLNSSIMKRIGLEEQNGRIVRVMSILDLGNFIDVDEEIPMYTVESTLIISVFDYIVHIYNLTLDSIQTIEFDSLVTCIRTWNDHLSQFLGIMREKEYNLYQYKLF